jgi:hypothetical protein
MTTVAPTGDDTTPRLAETTGRHPAPRQRPWHGTWARRVDHPFSVADFALQSSTFDRGGPSARHSCEGRSPYSALLVGGRTRSPALVVDDADAPRAPSPTGSPGTLRPRRQGPPAKGEAAPVERRNDFRPWATGALPAALPRPPQLLRPPLRPRLRPTSTARRRQARRRARRRGPHRGRSRADRQLRPLRLTGARRIKRRPGSRSTSGARAYSWRAAARSLGLGRAS